MVIMVPHSLSLLRPRASHRVSGFRMLTFGETYSSTLTTPRSKGLGDPHSGTAVFLTSFQHGLLRRLRPAGTNEGWGSTLLRNPERERVGRAVFTHPGTG